MHRILAIIVIQQTFYFLCTHHRIFSVISDVTVVGVVFHVCLLFNATIIAVTVPSV